MTVNSPATIKIGEHTISNRYFEKLLGVKIDSQINDFETIIKKASQKVHVLARVRPYTCISKRNLQINVFFKAQFSYCPLVWLCFNRSMNNKINRL